MEVGHLSPAGKQIVSMARALSRDIKLIIMDEPSAILDSGEVANLFRVVRELTAQGIAVASFGLAVTFARPGDYASYGVGAGRQWRRSYA